jgi:hypothetical protein
MRAMPHSSHDSSLSVRTSRHTYAAMLSTVKTKTTLPLVLNFLRCSPSSPISEKNCLFPAVLSVDRRGLTCNAYRPGLFARGDVAVDTLMAAEQAREQNARPVDGKESADGVELGSEDL